jgi:hypothetical protein
MFTTAKKEWEHTVAPMPLTNPIEEPVQQLSEDQAYKPVTKEANISVEDMSALYAKIYQKVYGTAVHG